jgi:ABC-type lipoprotein release transport system permease subunit
VLRQIVGNDALVCLLGLINAILIALMCTRLRGFLFGISPADPVTLLPVATTPDGDSVLASYIPTRRATEIDPVEALRRE